MSLVLDVQPHPIGVMDLRPEATGQLWVVGVNATMRSATWHLLMCSEQDQTSWSVSHRAGQSLNAVLLDGLMAFMDDQLCFFVDTCLRECCGGEPRVRPPVPDEDSSDQWSGDLDDEEATNA